MPHPIGAERQFAHTAKGHKTLIAWLQQWPIERIAYEATGTYHRALEAALTAGPNGGTHQCPRRPGS